MSDTEKISRRDGIKRFSNIAPAFLPYDLPTEKTCMLMQDKCSSYPTQPLLPTLPKPIVTESKTLIMVPGRDGSIKTAWQPQLEKDALERGYLLKSLTLPDISNLGNISEREKTALVGLWEEEIKSAILGTTGKRFLEAWSVGPAAVRRSFKRFLPEIKQSGGLEKVVFSFSGPNGTLPMIYENGTIEETCDVVNKGLLWALSEDDKDHLRDFSYEGVLPFALKTGPKDKISLLNLGRVGHGTNPNDYISISSKILEFFERV